MVEKTKARLLLFMVGFRNLCCRASLSKLVHQASQQKGPGLACSSSLLLQGRPSKVAVAGAAWPVDACRAKVGVRLIAVLMINLEASRELSQQDWHGLIAQSAQYARERGQRRSASSSYASVSVKSCFGVSVLQYSVIFTKRLTEKYHKSQPTSHGKTQHGSGPRGPLDAYTLAPKPGTRS